MTNEQKDRHVIAAAAHSGAHRIFTFNLRHFQPEHVSRWSISAQHPQQFLTELFREDATTILAKLKQQAANCGRTFGDLLSIPGRTVPEFASLVSRSRTGVQD
jgi:hypothetical protein